jgi:hypothetical protein
MGATSRKAAPPSLRDRDAVGCPYAHGPMSSLSPLVKANLLVLGLLVLHTVDHAVGQPSRELPGSSSLVGAIGFALIAGSSWLALQRSPRAPEASALVGMLTAGGIIAVHLLPSWWGWVSDPYWDFDASFLSWLSLIALLASSLYLAAIGLRDQRLRPVKPSYRH